MQSNEIETTCSWQAGVPAPKHVGDRLKLPGCVGALEGRTLPLRNARLADSLC